MTDRYDVTHLQKQIFFSQLKEFFELIVVYSVYCIIHLEMFIDFFFVLYKVLQTHSVQKQDKKKMENLDIDPSTSRMLSGRSTI